MYKSSATASLSDVTADSVINLSNSTLEMIEENTVMMSDSAKVVGGDNLEIGLGASYTNLAENSQLGGIRLGDGANYHVTDMSAETAGILDRAINMVSLNANNFMAFAAGRDANLALADESNVINSGTDRMKAVFEGIQNIFTPARLGVAAVVIIGAYWLLKGKGRK